MSRTVVTATGWIEFLRLKYGGTGEGGVSHSAVSGSHKTSCGAHILRDTDDDEVSCKKCLKATV